MPRPMRGLILQDFARDGEDLLDTLLASAQRASVLPGDVSGQDHPRQDRLEHAGGFGNMPAMSEEGSSGSARSAESVHIDMSSMQHYRNRVGPELRHMRQAQGRNREYYTLDHLRRLKQFEAKSSYNEGKCSDYCKDFHVQPCRACTTCHFCRQKTIDEKTYCPCYNSTKRIIGGKGRGFWCGSCLYIRMGENIHEVKHRRDWRCPCCRDICNCSGANCLRARRNLAVTNQLIHEATKQGFKSVAHYLILTHLSEQGGAMPMMDITNMRKRSRSEEEGQLLVDNPVFKQARLAFDMSQDAKQRAGARFRETAAQHMRKQLQLLKAELPLPPESSTTLASMAAAGFGSHVLEDDQCDDEDDITSSGNQSGSTADGLFGMRSQQAAGSGPSGPAQRGPTPEFTPAINSHTEESTFPETSFAAFAQGVAQRSRQSASRGASSRSGNTTGPHEPHVAQSTVTIADSSPWDGPHPGLGDKTANVSTRLGHRAPIGMVKLPANLMPPVRRTVRAARAGSTDRGSAVHAAQSRQSESRSDQQRPMSSSGALSRQSRAAEGIAASSPTNQQQHRQQSAGQHSAAGSPAPPDAQEADTSGAADSPVDHSRTADVRHQGSSGISSGLGRVNGDTAGTSGSRPVTDTEAEHPTTAAFSGTPGTAADADAAEGSGTSQAAAAVAAASGSAAADAGPAAAPQANAAGPAAAADSAEAQQQQAGRLCQVWPDKPGHLASVEQCWLANGGMCWHLLQMAVRARAMAQKSNDAHIHEGYSNLVKGLLEKILQDHTTSVGISAAAFMPADADTSAQSSGHSVSHLKTHADLRYAVALLLLAAEALPVQDVEFTVCRLLFDQEPFVNFTASDLQARAMLIKASFDLFTIMQRRGIQVEGVCRGIMHMLGSLTSEYAELLSRLAVKQAPMEMGQELHVGPIHMAAATTLEGMNDHMAVLISFTVGDEDLLKVFLQYIQSCCSKCTPRTSMFLLAPELADLLEGSRVVRPEVRHGAMSAVYAAMAAAMQYDEQGEALAQGEAKLLAQHIQAKFMHPIEQLLMPDYPLRCPPAAEAAEPAATFKLDEVSVSLKVEVLARAYALMAQTGLLGWSHLELAAVKPFHPRTFWKHANTLYRHFSVFFLAHALHANHRLASFTAAAVEVMSLWLRTVFDDGKRNALKYFTLVVASSPHIAALFQGVSDTQQALLADSTGEVRGHIVYTVLQEAANHPQWRSHVPDLFNDLDDILAARSREVSATPAHQFEWERAATSICAAMTQAAGHLLLAHKSGPNGATLLSMLLKRMTLWMAHAATYLQRCHHVMQQESASTAFMGGLGAEQALDNIAQARQALQSSALHHMPTAFQQVLSACTVQAGQQPSSQFLASQMPLLQPLHILITACLETPTAALTANPVDVALYEALADALAPVGRTSAQEGQRVSAESLPHRVVPIASLYQDGLTRERQLLHFVLGTYVRRYFCRSSFGHAVHQRPAVNAMRFLERLFTQPSLRGADGALAALLPPLLAPILEALCPLESGLQRTASLPTKQAIYFFLQSLLMANPSLIPPPLPPAPLSSMHFQNGPLQTGAQVPVDRFAVAMHAFLQGVCGDVQACVWKLCAPGISTPTNTSTQHSGYPLCPLTPQGCRTACGSLFSVLGPPRSLESIEALYSAQGAAPGAAAAPGEACWPADFSWRLAEAALGFLGALGGAGQHGKLWLQAACPCLHQAMTTSPAHSRPLRPAYQQLLTVLQSQGVAINDYALPAPHLPLHQQLLRHAHQQQQQPHYPGLDTHQRQHQHCQAHLAEQHRQQPQEDMSESHDGQAAGAALVVKTEGQRGSTRQQVYAHNVPFATVANLQPGDLVGLMGWLRRPPSLKTRKNGDSVLLLDLEDQHGSSIRVICLGSVKTRAMDLVNQRQGTDSQTPHILSLTNVAVSKQKALLHATAATHVQEACNSSATSEIRQHALQILADSRLQASCEPQLSAAVTSSAAQADDQSQRPLSATQQSVAMSSQRTAQYHWGATPQAPTQAEALASQQQSHAGTPVPSASRQEHGQSTEVVPASSNAASSSMLHQHRKAVYANQEAQQTMPTAAGMTAADIAQTLIQLCDMGSTDRAAARAALKQAIQEGKRGKEAIANRAAEIVLLS